MRDLEWKDKNFIWRDKKRRDKKEQDKINKEKRLRLHNKGGRP